MSSSRLARAYQIAGKINKDLGEGTVVLGRDIHKSHKAIPRFSSGNLALDVALGGGWPARWNELIGESSAGRSAVAFKTVAHHLVNDPEFICVWVAAEDFDEEWATILGITDWDRMILVENNIAEVALQTVIDYLEEGAADCYVIDSLPFLTTLAEDEGDMDDKQVAEKARLMSLFFRKTFRTMRQSLVESTRPMFGMIVNQYREKIGVTWGDNRTTPGGRAKEYAAFTRVQVQRGDLLLDDHLKDVVREKKAAIGQEIKFHVLKNKAAPPFRTGMTDFYFSDGERKGVKHLAGSYDDSKDVLTTAKALGVVEFSGGKWRDLAGKYEWKNKDALEDAITVHGPLRDDIRQQVLDYIARRDNKPANEGRTKIEEAPPKKPRRTVVRRKGKS